MSEARAAFCFAFAMMIATAPQTSSEPLTNDFFAPTLSGTGAVLPNYGRMEITLLSRREFIGMKVIQMKRTGEEKPDAFAIYVPHPMYPDEPGSGLYCYISPDEGEAFKETFVTGDLLTSKEPISGEAKALMEDFAKQVEIATKGIATDKIGFGIGRQFAESAYDALKRVLDAPGGCNWPTPAATLGPS